MLRSICLNVFSKADPYNSHKKKKKKKKEKEKEKKKDSPPRGASVEGNFGR